MFGPSLFLQRSTGVAISGLLGDCRCSGSLANPLGLGPGLKLDNRRNKLLLRFLFSMHCYRLGL